LSRQASSVAGWSIGYWAAATFKVWRGLMALRW
jgi:hypothetical protein